MKMINALKTIAISFVVSVLTFLLFTGVVAQMNEQAYADSFEVAQAFVGHPSSSVLDNYGRPAGWAFINGKEENEVCDAVWYYDQVVFYVHYDNAANAEGVIAAAEVLH